jgi:hypothetical protein
MNIEVYKWGLDYHFNNDETEEEGKIILGSSPPGGETYKYVSHLEECDDISEERQDEIISFLEDNFNLILNAKPL